MGGRDFGGGRAIETGMRTDAGGAWRDGGGLEGVRRIHDGNRNDREEGRQQRENDARKHRCHVQLGELFDAFPVLSAGIPGVAELGVCIISTISVSAAANHVPG